MKPSTILAAASLTGFAAARALHIEKRDSSLEVKLSQVSNTLLKAIVKNVGSTDLNLFNKGNILDKAEIEKVKVTQQSKSVRHSMRGSRFSQFLADTSVPFHGVRFRMAAQNLNPSLFTEIKAGQQVEVEFDTGSVHDLSSGGYYQFLASGAIPIADASLTKLSRSAVVFKSNALHLNVDGAKAALVTRFPRLDHLAKRAILDPEGNCSEADKQATETAISECKRMADKAAAAATNGTATK